jgi:hypothetical protein
LFRHLCERAGKGRKSLREFEFFSIRKVKSAVSIVVNSCVVRILYTRVSYVPHKEEGSMILWSNCTLNIRIVHDLYNTSICVLFKIRACSDIQWCNYCWSKFLTLFVNTDKILRLSLLPFGNYVSCYRMILRTVWKAVLAWVSFVTVQVNKRYAYRWNWTIIVATK